MAFVGLLLLKLGYIRNVPNQKSWIDNLIMIVMKEVLDFIVK